MKDNGWVGWDVQELGFILYSYEGEMKKKQWRKKFFFIKPPEAGGHPYETS